MYHSKSSTIRWEKGGLGACRPFSVLRGARSFLLGGFKKLQAPFIPSAIFTGKNFTNVGQGYQDRSNTVQFIKRVLALFVVAQRTHALGCFFDVGGFACILCFVHVPTAVWSCFLDRGANTVSRVRIRRQHCGLLFHFALIYVYFLVWFRAFRAGERQLRREWYQDTWLKCKVLRPLTTKRRPHKRK